MITVDRNNTGGSMFKHKLAKEKENEEKTFKEDV